MKNNELSEYEAVLRDFDAREEMPDFSDAIMSISEVENVGQNEWLTVGLYGLVTILIIFGAILIGYAIYRYALGYKDNKKPIIIGIVLLVAAGVSFYLGSSNNTSLDEQKEEARVLAANTYIYHIEDRGDEIEEWLHSSKNFLQYPKRMSHSSYQLLMQPFFRKGYYLTKEEDDEFYKFYEELYIKPYLKEFNAGNFELMERWNEEYGDKNERIRLPNQKRKSRDYDLEDMDDMDEDEETEEYEDDDEVEVDEDEDEDDEDDETDDEDIDEDEDDEEDDNEDEDEDDE